MKSPDEYANTTKSEFAHQAALIQWASVAIKFGLAAAGDDASYKIAGHAEAYGTWRNDRIPQLAWLHAIKNQGHGDKIRGAKSSAEGVKAGIPDLFLPFVRFDICGEFDSAGLYIEMKKPIDGVVSNVQETCQTYLVGQQYTVVNCWHWTEARNALLSYLKIKSLN
jgi:hypothetical protein